MKSHYRIRHNRVWLTDTQTSDGYRYTADPALYLSWALGRIGIDVAGELLSGEPGELRIYRDFEFHPHDHPGLGVAPGPR